jgi:hypothetical protein
VVKKYKKLQNLICLYSLLNNEFHVFWRENSKREKKVMNNSLNIDEELYRHAKFLQTLTLNEHEVKLIRLFLKSNQDLTVRTNNSLEVEDHALTNTKIAVEY